MPFVIERGRLSIIEDLLQDEKREMMILKQICPSEALDSLGEFAFLRQYLEKQLNRIQHRVDFLDLMSRNVDYVAGAESNAEDAIRVLDRVIET